jgi:hypothetical protein
VKRSIHELVRPDGEVIAPVSNFNGGEASVARTIHPERSLVIRHLTRETCQGMSSSSFCGAPPATTPNRTTQMVSVGLASR